MSNSCALIYEPKNATDDNTWNKDEDASMPNEPPGFCRMDAFFEEQKKLHPSRRSFGAMLVCNCPKCTRISL